MAVNAHTQSSPQTSPNSSLSLFRLVAVCFFLSGATGLIYEVLWVRMLGLVFGTTTVAISAVLCAFMSGLALGSAIAARAGLRLSRPVRTYGLIEITVGLYALAVPFLFRTIDWTWVHWFSHFGFDLSRYLLATLVLIVPTGFMGATLPVLASARYQGDRQNRATVLYTCNLSGAIAGAIVTGFILLPVFGVRNTILIAASVNVIIGLVAMMAELTTREAAKKIEIPSGIPSFTTYQISGSSWFWLCCAFASGLITITMQIVWSRLLAMIIGSSTYAFSLVLGLFLACLSLGAFIVTRLNKRTNKLRSVLMVVEALTASSLFLSIPITNSLPALLVRTGLRLGVDSWPGLLALQVIAAAMMIFVPAVLMGMVLPLVLLWAGNATRVGRSYAINTIGAIAGSIFTAFVLIPKTNTRFTIYCMTALCLLVSGWAYEPRNIKTDRALSRSLAFGGAVSLILFAFVSWPRLDLNALSSGAYDSYVRILAGNRGLVNDSGGPENINDHQLLMFDEGRTATVSVRRDWGITSAAINGRTNGSDGADMPTQIMLAQFGILAAPRLDRALVVGFATGVTPGSILQSPIKSLDAIEIEPAAVASSRFFEQVNKLPLADPRLHLIIDDARNYLSLDPKQYDFIVSEPSHPWVPGVANLFTQEFFVLGRDHLENDGVFVQWLQTYQLSTDSLRSVLATFNEVFPWVTIFRVLGPAKGKDLILMGSRSAINFDLIKARSHETRSAIELNRAGITNSDELASWFVCDQIQLRSAVAGAVINTDDNMHLESVAPYEAFRASMQDNGEWLEKLKNLATVMNP